MTLARRNGWVMVPPPFCAIYLTLERGAVITATEENQSFLRVRTLGPSGKDATTSGRRPCLSAPGAYPGARNGRRSGGRRRAEESRCVIIHGRVSAEHAHLQPDVG